MKFDPRLWFRIALYTVMAVVATWIVLKDHPHPLETGTKAPLESVVRSYDGLEWPLARFKGKTMVINFWASWCKPCVQELPVLAAFANENAENVVVIGLTIDSPAKEVAELVRRFGITYPIAQATAATAQAFGATTVPTTYIIDEGGKVIWSKVGQLGPHDLSINAK